MAARSNPAKKPSKTMAAIALRTKMKSGRRTIHVQHVTLVRWRALLTLARERVDMPDDRFRKKVLYAVLGIQTLAEAPWCGRAWEVTNSAAQGGYGPMLYDVSMTLARNAGVPGLIPDRRSVSPEAQGLWRFYKDRRADVDAEPLSIFCPRHAYFTNTVLDHVFSLNREPAGIRGLTDRGIQTWAALVYELGVDGAADYLYQVRRIFWECYFQGKCPVGVDAPAKAVAQRRDAQRRASQRRLLGQFLRA